MKSIIEIGKIQNLLGECPVWDDVDHCLYWIDCLLPAVHRFSPITQEHVTWKMPALIGSIALRQQGGLVAFLGKGLAFISPSGQVAMQQLVLAEGYTANDGKCDAKGRFWAGSVGPRQQPASGNLYCFTQSDSSSIAQKNIGISNGIEWSLDNQFMYYTDSKCKTIIRFHFNLDTGAMTHGECWYQHEGKGTPDGMTIDCDGNLWSAIYNEQRIICLSPKGKILQSISVPARRPTSCCFGGEQFKTLFVTSMSQDIGDAVAEEAPAGNTFALNIGAKGNASYKANF